MGKVSDHGASRQARRPVSGTSDHRSATTTRSSWSGQHCERLGPPASPDSCSRRCSRRSLLLLQAASRRFGRRVRPMVLRRGPLDAPDRRALRDPLRGNRFPVVHRGHSRSHRPPRRPLLRHGVSGQRAALRRHDLRRCRLRHRVGPSASRPWGLTPRATRAFCSSRRRSRMPSCTCTPRARPVCS